MIALSVKGATQKLGATQTNQLINLQDFFASSVLPELQAAAAGGGGTSQPILLADSVKFVTTFRNQLPREMYETVLPLLLSLLTHRAPVVHTYAANAIERMLAVREPGSNALRFGAAQLAPSRATHSALLPPCTLPRCTADRMHRVRHRRPTWSGASPASSARSSCRALRRTRTS